MVKKYSVKKGMKKFVAKKAPVKQFMGQKTYAQKIQIPTNVYAWTSGGGVHLYSFTTTGNDFNYNINAALDASDEYLKLKNNYQIFKINGVAIRPESVMAPNSLLTSAPPLYFVFTPDVSTLTNETAVSNDGSLKCFPLSGSSTKGKYFDMSQVMVTTTGYPLTGMWRSTTISTTSALHLLLGFSDLPTGLAPNSSAVVLNVMVDVYCTFSCRYG